MNKYPSDIVFTPTVKRLQEEYGSRDSYAHYEQNGGGNTAITPTLVNMAAETDMLYLGTSNADGLPYIQYRGGPKGFLKVLDETTLAFADFAGNQQFISTGNLLDNPKAFIFLMDYENRKRIKIWGKAKAVTDDPELLSKLSDPSYPALVVRAIVFEIDFWALNCRQHIHRRIPEEKHLEIVATLEGRIAELEAKLAEKT